MALLPFTLTEPQDSGQQTLTPKLPARREQRQGVFRNYPQGETKWPAEEQGQGRRWERANWQSWNILKVKRGQSKAWLELLKVLSEIHQQRSWRSRQGAECLRRGEVCV